MNPTFHHLNTALSNWNLNLLNVKSTLIIKIVLYSIKLEILKISITACFEGFSTWLKMFARISDEIYIQAFKTYTDRQSQAESM